jgi:hypothetical protein
MPAGLRGRKTRRFRHEHMLYSDLHHRLAVTYPIPQRSLVCQGLQRPPYGWPQWWFPANFLWLVDAQPFAHHTAETQQNKRQLGCTKIEFFMVAKLCHAESIAREVTGHHSSPPSSPSLVSQSSWCRTTFSHAIHCSHGDTDPSGHRVAHHMPANNSNSRLSPLKSFQ